MACHRFRTRLYNIAAVERMEIMSRHSGSVQSFPTLHVPLRLNHTTRYLPARPNNPVLQLPLPPLLAR